MKKQAVIFTVLAALKTFKKRSGLMGSLMLTMEFQELLNDLAVSHIRCEPFRFDRVQIGQIVVVVRKFALKARSNGS